MFFFIVFPLSLNLNNTSTTLASSSYLGTLKWNTINTKWKFYEKTCLVFQKNKFNWFLWLVFIHVRTKSWFSIQFLHVMVSISFRYENQIKN